MENLESHALLKAATYLIRFLDVIRGTRIAPPNKLEPVMNMPLSPPARPTCQHTIWRAIDTIEQHKRQ